MGTITIVPYVAGNDVTAEGQNSNESIIANEFNGNIDNANIKANAGIIGSKIADAPNGISTGKINDDAVDASKLKDDPSVDANRAVTTNHIRDAAVTNAKVTNLTLGYGKLNANTYSWVPGGILNAGNGISVNTGLTAASKPIQTYIEATSAAFANSASLIIQVRFDTTTNTWWLVLFNTSGSVNLAALTFKLLYMFV